MLTKKEAKRRDEIVVKLCEKALNGREVSIFALGPIHKAGTAAVGESSGVDWGSVYQAIEREVDKAVAAIA